MFKGITKFLTYDLETTFIQKGQKRHNTRLLEIALYGDNKKYQTLINPLKTYDSGQEIIQSLENLNQHPDNTIRFWTKLLIEKKMLNTATKRKSILEKAEAISSLLKTSTEFETTENALKQFITFGNEHICIAHNGKAFDSKILDGNCKRLDIHHELTFADSLPLFRHYIKDAYNYKQPYLYNLMFKKKYFAHHALEDAKALHKLLKHMETKQEKDLIELYQSIPKKSRIKKYKTDLLDIKGIGPKSVAALFEQNIKNKKDLIYYIQTNTYEKWIQQFKNVHAYKKLGEQLFKNEIKLIPD